MPTLRHAFAELPEAARTAVTAHTGPIIETHAVESGLQSAIAARLKAENGSYFVKGLPSGHPRVWTQAREADVGALVEPIAPRVLFRVQEGGWDLIGFEVLDGPHADYRPVSADLPLVAGALTWLSQQAVPEGVEVKDAADRMRDLVPSDQLHHFYGDTLAHTDPNPSNVLVVDGRARLVDWAWVTRGPAWLDAAYWSLWLVVDGHSVDSARTWASRIPAYEHAPRAALTVFARAQCDLWESIAAADPVPWTQSVHAAAQACADSRTTTTR
ncbi:aminoglycoside phosphotransferase [Streptomyces venezuelae]|uniref:phosphotransferase family protein n=1 Tax=Streptomyces venezuelae TaxID=54571 RepID=UPI003452C7F3